MSTTYDQPQSHVYLTGDPNPIESCLPVEVVARRVLDMHEAAGDTLTPIFVQLTMPDGRTALVAPRAIAAILPLPDDD